MWDYQLCECVDSCPLIVDTSGRGYRLTDVADGVQFDINGDGRTEQLSLTDPDRDVGFLAVDRNGNGVIDDGEELFGSATPIAWPSGVTRASNGFEALATLDRADAPDGTVDASDPGFATLMIWIDRNHDGRSQQSEISIAASLGLIGIETTYRPSKRRDKNGNEYRLRGVSWWKLPGREKPQARLMYDVWLATRDTSLTSSH